MFGFNFKFKIWQQEKLRVSSSVGFDRNAFWKTNSFGKIEFNSKPQREEMHYMEMPMRMWKYNICQNRFAKEWKDQKLWLP